MAGLRSNQAWWAIQKQTTSGTAAAGTAASVHKIPFAGGSIGPVREHDRLAETDSSVDQGDPYVTSAAVEGSPEAYARASYLPLLLHGALNGTIGTTGAAAPWTHTIDADTKDLPRFTVWKAIGSQDATTPFNVQAPGIAERFVDCRIGSLTISGEAGGALTVAAGMQGRISERLDAPAAVNGLAVANDAPFTFNHATDYAAAPDTSLITFANGATFMIRSFELTIENNLSRQQTNSLYPMDTQPGIREVTLGFDMIYDSNTHYNQFNYAGGTEVAPNVYTVGSTHAAPAAKFTFRINANTEVTFSLPKLALEEFPVEPDPSGDPVVVPVRAVATRGTTAEPIVRAIVKNSLAATAYAAA